MTGADSTRKGSGRGRKAGRQNKVRISVAINRDTLTRIKMFCKLSKRSMSDVFNEALLDYLKKHSRISPELVEACSDSDDGNGEEKICYIPQEIDLEALVEVLYDDLSRDVTPEEYAMLRGDVRRFKSLCRKCYYHYSEELRDKVRFVRRRIRELEKEYRIWKIRKDRERYAKRTARRIAGEAEFEVLVKMLYEELSGEVEVSKYPRLRSKIARIRKLRALVEPDPDLKEKLKFIFDRYYKLEKLYWKSKRKRSPKMRMLHDEKLRPTCLPPESPADSQEREVSEKTTSDVGSVDTASEVSQLIEELRQACDEYRSAKGIFARRKREKLRNRILELVEKLEGETLSEEEREVVERVISLIGSGSPQCRCQP